MKNCVTCGKALLNGRSVNMKTLKQLREAAKKNDMPGLIKTKGHVPKGFVPLLPAKSVK